MRSHVEFQLHKTASAASAASIAGLPAVRACVHLNMPNRCAAVRGLSPETTAWHVKLVLHGTTWARGTDEAQQACAHGVAVSQ